MPNSPATTSASAPFADAPGARPSQRATLIVCLAGGATLLAIASVRLLRDGSFWLDEASIAVNLIQQRPLALLGALETGHNFPRLYLISISVLMETFGYHTMLLRLLPFCAFVAGLAVWLRLGFVRFRSQPLLLALLLALSLIPGTWLAYAAMLKQYTMDVLVALVPFLLSDAFFDRRLRDGRDRASLLALPLLCLLSFSFLVPLLGRVIAWYLAALARGRAGLDRKSSGLFAASLAGSLGALWLLDLRHTAGSAQLFGFWSKCIPGNDWSRAPEIVGNFFTGWYRGLPHAGGAPLPEPLIGLLMLGLVGGCLEIVRRSLGRGERCDEDEARWGSRSLGCLVTIGGVLAASLLVQYPICPGRITLFALFPMLIVTVEGFNGAARLLSRTKGGHWLALGSSALVLLLILPTSYTSARLRISRDVPENIRPLLHHIDAKPDLPVLVASCSTRQLSTLPEWQGRDDIIYYDEPTENGQLHGLGDLRHFWVVSTGSNFYCPWFFAELENRASRIKRYHTTRNSASLLEVWISEGASDPDLDTDGGADHAHP